MIQKYTRHSYVKFYARRKDLKDEYNLFPGLKSGLNSMEAMNICGNYSNEIGVCVLKIEVHTKCSTLLRKARRWGKRKSIMILERAGSISV